jgi:hypothetical protein
MSIALAALLTETGEVIKTKGEAIFGVGIFSAEANVEPEAFPAGIDAEGKVYATVSYPNGRIAGTFGLPPPDLIAGGNRSDLLES